MCFFLLFGYITLIVRNHKPPCGGATLKFCTKATQDSKDLKKHFLLSQREELTFSSLFCEEEMGVWVNLKSFFFFLKIWIIKQKNKQGTKNKTHNISNNNKKTRSLLAQSKAITYVTGNNDDHSIYSLPINKRNTKKKKKQSLSGFLWTTVTILKTKQNKTWGKNSYLLTWFIQAVIFIFINTKQKAFPYKILDCY